MEAHLYADLIEFSPTFFMIIANMLILYIVMRYFFWDKIHNFMEARQRALRESFESAELTNELADKKLAEYEDRIAQIENEGRDIIKNSKIKADAQAKNIIDEASQKASDMLVNAEKEIERQKLKAISEMQEHVAGLAIYAAEKILEKQLDVGAQNELIQSILQEAGNAKWQN